MDRATISRKLSTWGWSYRAVENKQLAKYTTMNKTRYVYHVLAMPRIVLRHGIERVKYIDEVHFVTSKLHKKKGVGPKGKAIAV